MLILEEALSVDVFHTKKRGRISVENSESELRRFRDFVIASKAFSTTEKAAIQIDSFDGFAAFWSQVNNAKQKFDSHCDGDGSLSRNYQESSAAVYDFMRNFSPIIDIVKDFAAPYGGLAIGAMSALFAVAKNKNDVEKRLGSTISAIRDRLPGLEMYRRIYNDNNAMDILLQNRIMHTYLSFIDFAIAATKYYKSSRKRQWLKAFGPQCGVVEKANKLQSEIVKMRGLCEDLLTKNVDELKRSNNELSAQLKNLQRGTDNDRVRHIQQLLNLESFSSKAQRESLESYHKALAHDDQLSVECFQQMRGQNLNSFKFEPHYQQWATSLEPCFLILSGYNNESIFSASQSWLSPVATALIGDLVDTESCLILAYSILLHSGKLVFDVLPEILLQLLKQKSQALRDENQYSELQSELRNFHIELDKSMSSVKNEEIKLTALHKAALRVISFFDKSETVYIIVDRADRCQDQSRGDHRMKLLRIFLKLVEAARCTLKVLVVINGYYWPASMDLNDLRDRAKDRLVIRKVEQQYRT